jgi:chloramphenicol 3-O phosphotransferase
MLSSSVMSGVVIVLNGPSASGKSSIQRRLQDELAVPHLAMGLDSLLVGLMPQRYFTSQPPDREQVMWGDATTDASGAPLFTLHFGPVGRRALAGMHNAIAAYASAGNHAIVDYIVYEPEFVDELAEALRPVTAYFIGVRIGLDVLEERERRRGTSPVGHARSHYDVVHAHGVYDLEVDTGRESSEACAAKIAAFVRENPRPSAFRTLRERVASAL